MYALGYFICLALEEIWTQWQIGLRWLEYREELAPITTSEVSLAITLVTLVTPGTVEMSLGELTPITTFKTMYLETPVENSLRMVETSIQALLLELSMQTLLLELSPTMDLDLITILPEMSDWIRELHN